jgi:N-dimethylarginine dimethylaminohydrolase
MSKKILMCSAEHFDLEYDINAWMSAKEHVNQEAARHEWRNVFDIYTGQLGWDVDIIAPIKGLPDMVFATDCSLIIDGKVMLSSFRFPERRGETEHFEKWLREHGFADFHRPKYFFEGGGDNLVCGDKILAGHGFRSDPEAANEMREYFGREVVPLKIVDPYFYHLDTSVAVLNDDTVAFYPGAIDNNSQKRLRAAIPNVIEATLEEAQGFGLNAVSDGKTVITSNMSESLLQKYRDAGFRTIGASILEFRKSGGGVKCMTLELRDYLE